MSWFAKYLRSSVGAKHIMAITGLALLGFVIMHMVGNLQLFLGRESGALNNYALGLKNLGALLWVARIGLLVLFLVHVGSALRLVSMNRAARPVKYKKVKSDKSTFASRVMPMSGLIVLAFLAFHLMHFTLGGGPFSEEFNVVDQYGRHDVYRMVVSGFQNTPIALGYIFCNILLCLHLSHGVSSIFQSLGFNHSKYNGLFKMSGPLVASLILIGNCSMPIAVLIGKVTL